MKKIDWNGPDFEYLVRYRFDDEFSPWKQIVIEDPLAVSCTKCFLHFFTILNIITASFFLFK